MAVYQDKAKERIKKGLRRMTNIVNRGIKDEYKEADTRTIVTDLLTEYLGWNKYLNVTAEQMIGSRYADFVVRTPDEEIFVIEVKQIGMKLKETHLNQARLYAIDEGIEWIILTNGDEWHVYHISMDGKTPVTKLVFSVKLSDDKMKPSEKAELLYLLSEEANRKKEIDDYFNRRIALSGENLADHILSSDVLDKLRISLKKSTGQRLSNSEIAEALIDRLFRDDKVTEDHHKAIKRMQRLERQGKPRKQPENQSGGDASGIECGE